MKVFEASLTDVRLARLSCIVVIFCIWDSGFDTTDCSFSFQGSACYEIEMERVLHCKLGDGLCS